MNNDTRSDLIASNFLDGTVSVLINKTPWPDN
jgi:hypothetical protein